MVPRDLLLLAAKVAAMKYTIALLPGGLAELVFFFENKTRRRTMTCLSKKSVPRVCPLFHSMFGRRIGVSLAAWFLNHEEGGSKTFPSRSSSMIGIMIYFKQDTREVSTISTRRGSLRERCEVTDLGALSARYAIRESSQDQDWSTKGIFFLIVPFEHN